MHYLKKLKSNKSLRVPNLLDERSRVVSYSLEQMAYMDITPNSMNHKVLCGHIRF